MTRNKFFWLGLGAVLILTFLVTGPKRLASPPSTAEPPTTVAPTLMPTVAAETTGNSLPASSQEPETSSQPFAETLTVMQSPSPTASNMESANTACPAAQPVAEGAPVWLTTNGHTFATASGRVFSSGIALTGQRTGNYCETTQIGPFGSEWVQVP